MLFRNIYRLTLLRKRYHQMLNTKRKTHFDRPTEKGCIFSKHKLNMNIFFRLRFVFVNSIKITYCEVEYKP